MRVCLFTSTFLPKVGGHEIAMDELAKRLHADGHAVRVLAQTPSRWRRSQPLDRPYRVEWFAKPLSQKFAIGTFRRVLARSYRREPFDVVHTFSSYPTGYAALDLCRRERVPLIVTSQGGDLAEGSRYERRPAVMDRIRATLRDAAAVTNISRYMRDRALAIEPSCAPRMHDIPNAVDLPDLRRPPAATPAVPGLDGRPFVLFLGRLHPRKGVDVLIDAWGKLPAGPTQLVIAGTGREDERLRARAAVSASTRTIHLIGRADGDVKRWLLQNAAVVVAPTRTWEGMPVVVLEALACGRPVIGSDVGGIVDLVLPDRTGLLVPKEDPAALAAALARLLADAPLRNRLSRGAIDFIAPFDWSVVAGRYVDLYTRLLGDRGPTTSP